MDVPGVVAHPGDRFFWAAGPEATRPSAAALLLFRCRRGGTRRETAVGAYAAARQLAWLRIPRFFVGIASLFYGVETSAASADTWAGVPLQKSHSD